MNFNKIIFHIDLDAFFAQVEEVEDSNLKNKPVIICNPGKRAIVTTSNYIAREYGIYAGMPVFKAKELCKTLIMLSSNHKLYYQKSNDVFLYLREKYKVYIEMNSIDECYIDMTALVKKNNFDYLSLAKSIQNDIIKKFNLTLSIGISDRKELSKISTEFKKPKGISTLFKEEIPLKLYNKNIGVLQQVGIKTKQKLIKSDIKTVYDFIINYQENNENLKLIIGNKIDFIYKQATGNLDLKVNSDFRDVKNISLSRTFDKKLDDIELLNKVLNNQIKEIVNILHLESKKGNIISIEIKLGISERHSMSKTLSEHTYDYLHILDVSKKLMSELWGRYDNEPTKYISFSIGGIINIYEIYQQLNLNDLFFENNLKINDQLLKIIDQTNLSFNKKVVFIADNVHKSNKLKNKNRKLLNQHGIKLINSKEKLNSCGKNKLKNV